MMIVVEDMDSMPPRKILSVVVQCSMRPAIKPVHIIPAMITIAVISAGPPTSINLLKLNSSPSEKSRKMMPISAQIFTLSTFDTPSSRKFPLQRNPATM